MYELVMLQINIIEEIYDLTREIAAKVLRDHFSVPLCGSKCKSSRYYIIHKHTTRNLFSMMNIDAGENAILSVTIGWAITLGLHPQLVMSKVDKTVSHERRQFCNIR